VLDVKAAANYLNAININPVSDITPVRPFPRSVRHPHGEVKHHEVVILQGRAEHRIDGEIAPLREELLVPVRSGDERLQVQTRGLAF
jgi:hypothetical protein